MIYPAVAPQTQDAHPLLSPSPRSRVHIIIPPDEAQPINNTPLAQKGRVSSSFCFAFLVITTSLVFVQLLFLTGGVATYSPVICDNAPVEDSAQKLKSILPDVGRLHFPRTKRRLPQCIIIGARKCGTRALLEFLNLHPMVQKAAEEVHFFDARYDLGLDWYRRRMPYTFPGQITVEKSPAYFVTPLAPSRIRRMDPGARLLLIVRDPTTRLVSDYAQLAANRARRPDRPLPPFERLALDDAGAVDLGYRAVRVGMYALFFPRWLRAFPRRQIHVVDGDRLITDPFAEVQKIERFLGLDHRVLAENFYYNETKGFFCVRNATADKCLNDSKGRKHPTVSVDVLSTLRRFYAPYNEEFFKQAGVRFDWPSS